MTNQPPQLPPLPALDVWTASTTIRMDECQRRMTAYATSAVQAALSSQAPEDERDVALRKIGHECDVGEHTEIARAALQYLQPAAPVAPVAAAPERKLIGWRTENFLWETDDPDKARNWEPNIGVLPIFEGDPNTKLAASPTPPVQPDERPEMEQKWCWWLGDAESFHIADTESEAHGEAQSRVDEECLPGESHQYSVARVQHPIDSLGMDWLAEHVAESIEENACCWCDENTGAEEPSITLDDDDRKTLGVMVAGFLREKVGVHWWTADQKTVTVHTYVAGSNDDPALTAAQAEGGSK